MHIIGTAGHVDHGKSALVHALTGDETDRLPQEKERELTIELGFASYFDPVHKRIGVIDVPGHERFIKNMVSGTWAMELALLCIAADDGWMRQTTDHAHVLKGMNVPSIIVVVTKIDAVSDQRVQEVITNVGLQTKGIFYHALPIHAVSAHTLTGMEPLKQLIQNELTTLKGTHYPPMLYIDRAFTLKGIGTVVTGSLVGKEIEVGQNITILPANKMGKIRSLQMFSEQVTKAIPVSRCAIALQGIERTEAIKGSIATTDPQQFISCKEVYVTLSSITDHQNIEIKNHQHVMIAFGSNHSDATIHLLGDKQNKGTLLARLNLPEDAYFYHHQPMVVMAVGGSNVLCYAKVVYTRSLNRKMQRTLGTLFSQYELLPPFYEQKGILSLYLFSYAKDEQHLPNKFIIENEEYIKLGSFHIKSALLKTLQANILQKVSKPQGIPLQSAKYVESYPLELIEIIIQSLIDQQTILLCEGSLLLASNTDAQLSKRANELYKEIEACGSNGFPVKLLIKSDKEHIGCLLRNKKILIIDSSTIYLTKTYQKMVETITNSLSIGDTFSIADAKDRIGLSRKFMLPLLHQIERDGYIVRIGDLRKVIKKVNLL